MSEQFDVFMPCAPKDYGKLKYVVNQIKTHLRGFDKIYVSVQDADQLPNECHKLGLVIVEDRDVLNIDLRKCKYRPNWVYQQFLKMFQDVTEHNLFFTIDSDVFINRKVKMFEKGRRVIWMGWEQNHPPYFKFQEQMLGLPRTMPHTCINDTNFFDKKIIAEMLERNGYTVESFIHKSFEIITPECFPAEPEIYGQYVFKYHLDKHEFKQAKVKMIAKEISHTHWRHQAYSEPEIRAYIRDMAGLDLDFFMLHSWFTKNEVQQ